MRDWVIALIAIIAAISLFVVIDMVVKAEPWAHEPCPADPCVRIVERAIGCTDKSEACRWARRMATRCLPRGEFDL